ncbi:NAD-dependent epimerase/dehydratase family protein [Rhodococcus aerolatus]
MTRPPAAPPEVVLVSGVSGDVAARTAAAVARLPSVRRVLAVDTVPDRRGDLARTPGVELVRADLRTPAVARLLVDARVDTVVHAGLRSLPGAYGGRSALKDMNVLGSMALLAACQQAPTLRRLVVKSAADVYGATPRDPAVFTEDMEPRSVPGGGFARQAAEVEGYVRAFARRRPDVALTVLRLAHVIGPTVDTTFSRYFALPVVPTVLGHDARVQLLHETDAVDVLALAAHAPAAGTVNVAGDGVLLLSQAIRRAGRVSVAVPSSLVGLVGTAVRGARLVDFSPEQVRFLNVGRVVDSTRAREVLGFRPRYTTRAALDDFVRGRRLRPALPAATLRAVEQAAVAGTSAVASRVGR